jgi:hypothetical protein
MKRYVFTGISEKLFLDMSEVKLVLNELMQDVVLNDTRLIL